MPEFLFKPVPHNEAIDFIRSKPVVSREVFDQLLPELQARAFTIAGTIPADVMQTVRDLIADVPAGMPWDTQKNLITQALSPYMDEADAAAKAELLLRVHGQEAYASAADAVMRRQIRVFEYWQYRTMGDSKVRPAHAALDGLTLPATSPFWETHDPPWEWGCRCIKIPMSDGSVNDIRERQSKNDLGGGWLLSDRLRQELETTDRLVRGANVYNVAPTGTFKFDPQNLTLTVDQIKGRYSPEVWSNFESWARKTPIADRQQTVWEWMTGEPGLPERFSTADVADLTDKKILPSEASAKSAVNFIPIAPVDAQRGDEFLRGDEWIPLVSSDQLIEVATNNYQVRRKNVEAFAAPLPSGGHWVTIGGRHVLIGADALRFNTIEEGQAWANTHMHPDRLKLDTLERNAAIGYQNEGYEDINAALRGGIKSDAQLAAATRDIDRAMARSSLPSTITTYRGVDLAVASELKVGSTYRDAAFLSTSLSFDVARSFSNRVNAVFEITARAGTHAIYLNGLHEKSAREVEILFARGTSFKVVSKTIINGVTHIKLEVL